MRKPPLHFSNFNSHRGTTQTLVGAVVGALAGKAGAAPVAKAPRRSMTALDISSTPLVKGPPRQSTRPVGSTRILTNHTLFRVQAASGPKRTPPWQGSGSLLRIKVVAGGLLARQ